MEVTLQITLAPDTYRLCYSFPKFKERYWKIVQEYFLAWANGGHAPYVVMPLEFPWYYPL